MALTDDQKKQLADLRALEEGDAEEKASKKRREWIDAQIKKEEEKAVADAKAADEKKKKDEEDAKKKKRSWL
jgi:hypothetical protein